MPINALMRVRIKVAIDAIQRAQDAWTGAHWTHERPGSPIYCHGDSAAACATCAEAEQDARSAHDLSDEALTSLETILAAGVGNDSDWTAMTSDDGPLDRARRLEGKWGDDPAYRQALEAVRAIAQCDCGRITGERCEYDGPPSGLVLVETMPSHLRASHEAAGNHGSYPHNGAERLLVESSCAAALRDPWTRVVEEVSAR